MAYKNVVLVILLSVFIISTGTHLFFLVFKLLVLINKYSWCGNYCSTLFHKYIYVVFR